MISVVCFGICLAIVISCFRRGADVFSPMRVFGFTWSLALGMTELKLSGLQHTWSTYSWIVVVSGPVSFLIGSFIVTSLNIHKTLVPIGMIRSELRKEPTDTDRLYKLICASVAVYAAAYLVVYLVVGSVPVFSANPAIARSKFSLFGIGVLVNSMPFLLFFIVLYHILVPGGGRKKMFLKLLAIFSVVTYLLLLQRFQIIMAAVVSLVLLYYLTSRIRMKMILIIGAAVVAFFYVVSTLRAGQLLQLYLYTSSRMKFSVSYAIFTEPYMYLAMNLENMARAAERIDHLTFGYYSIDFVLALTGLKHWIAAYFALDEFPFLNSGYNSYSAFWIYYRDFGLFGVTLVPLFLGMTISHLYYSFRTSPTLRRLATYSVAVFFMILSFFVSPLGYLWFVYNVAAMILIFSLSTVRTVSTKLDG